MSNRLTADADGLAFWRTLIYYGVDLCSQDVPSSGHVREPV